MNFVFSLFDVALAETVVLSQVRRQAKITEGAEQIGQAKLPPVKNKL